MRSRSSCRPRVSTRLFRLHVEDATDSEPISPTSITTIDRSSTKMEQTARGESGESRSCGHRHHHRQECAPTQTHKQPTPTQRSSSGSSQPRTRRSSINRRRTSVHTSTHMHLHILVCAPFFLAPSILSSRRAMMNISFCQERPCRIARVSVFAQETLIFS
jgi:hypothetical protein